MEPFSSEPRFGNNPNKTSSFALATFHHFGKKECFNIKFVNNESAIVLSVFCGMPDIYPRWISVERVELGRLKFLQILFLRNEVQSHCEMLHPHLVLAHTCARKTKGIPFSPHHMLFLIPYLYLDLNFRRAPTRPWALQSFRG